MARRSTPPELPDDRWRRVRELFDAALDREPDDRAAFLAAECGDDEDLRREVASLLSADSEQGDPVAEAIDVAAPARPGATLRLGRLVGPYRIVDVVGEGGMGTVYLAEREDGAFQKKVAVKVVRAGLDSARVVDRFVRERRILGRLAHRHIAQILDAGTTDDGLPYLVMEYVDGERIDRHCDVRQLGLRARVRLVQQVCDAVSHAHQQLVVHRDLKPANLLVTTDGAPKLLDFGIAKILEDTAAAGDDTATRLRPMTPRYASPEQILGEPVSTATDVHALGILLYELLTGRHPFSEDLDSPRALEQAILDREATSLSTALSRERGPSTAEVAARRGNLSIGALRRELRGDLDRIVLKALAKEPERRYRSALELAEDLGRYLSGHPVAASPATFGYRAAKFLRRNRLAVGVAALLLATVLTAAVVSTRAYFAADQARREAEIQRDRLEEVNRFLAETFRAASPVGRQSPDEVTARAILDAGAERIETDLGDQPAVAAALQSEIGRRYHDLGVFDRAEELLRAAVAGHRSAGRVTPENATALIYLGQTLIETGAVEEAEATLREAVGVAAALGDDGFATSVEARKSLLRVLTTRGAYEEVVELYQELHDQLRAEPWRDDPEFVRLRASLANDWGLLLNRLGRYDEAEARIRDAIEDTRATYGAESSYAGQTWTNLGFVLGRAGRFEEAEAALRRGYELQRRVLGDDHLQTVLARMNLAGGLVKLGRIDEAEEHYPAVIAALRSIYGDRHSQVATAQNNAAMALMNAGDPAAAIPRFEEARAIYADAFGERHQYTAIAAHNVATAMHRAGRPEAEARCRATLELRREILDEGHPDIVRSEVLLSTILREKGQLAEAERLARAAVASATAGLAVDHPVRVSAEQELERCLEAVDRD
jgi:serine/threonine-protein kinase